MRYHVWFRTLVVIWGFWFTAALLEAPGVHTCAVHSAASTSAHMHSGGGAAAEMAAGGHDHGAAAGGAGHPHVSACTCLGVCCGAAPVVVAQQLVDLPSTVVLVASRPHVAADAVPLVARPHARPYANGPPASV